MAALLLVTLLLAAGTALARAPAAAPQQATYDLSWRVVAGGGGQVPAGEYALGGTAGQPAAGRVQEGAYNLCAGFWCRARAQAGYGVYLPLVDKVQEP